MKKQNSSPLFNLFAGGVCAAILALLPAKGQSSLINDDFDSSTAGSHPLSSNGWTVYSSGTTVQANGGVAPALSGSVNSLDLAASGDYAYNRMLWSAPISVANPCTYQLSYRIYLGSATGYSYMTFMGTNGSAAAGIEFNNGNINYLFQGSGGFSGAGGSYTPNTWYDVLLTFVPGTGLFNLSITLDSNGSSVVNLSGQTLAAGASDYGGNIFVCNYTGASVFLDNVILEPGAPPVPSASWLLDDGSGATPAALHGGSSLSGIFVGSGDSWTSSTPFAYTGDSSLNFSGSGGVQVADNASIDPTSVSVTAWIRHNNTTSSTYGIVQKGLSNGGYLLYLNGGHVGFKVQNSSGTTFSAQSSATTAGNVWHFVVGTFDVSSGLVKVYIDGVSVATTTGAAMATSAQSLYIGGAGNGTANYFPAGNIDEPAIYNYALSMLDVIYLKTHSIRPVYFEDFGAVGNGTSDDTGAVQQAGEAIQTNGGGTIALKPGKTYRVGTQVGSPLSVGGVAQPYWRCTNKYLTQGIAQEKWNSTDQGMCLYLYQLSGAFSLLGQNSTIKINDGLYMGAFDPNMGTPYTGSGGYVDESQSSNNKYIAQLGYCFWFSGCKNIQIRDLTLDGNVSKIKLGGYVGVSNQTNSYLCGGCGVWLNGVGLNNPGGQAQLTNCTFQNFAEDGLMIDQPGTTSSSPIEPIVLTSVTSNYNGRNGLSWVGGNSLSASGCTFNHQGQISTGGANPTSQPPQAGMDIENESGIITNGTFTNCQFEDNYGLAVPITAASNITFNNCTMWADGPGAWALYASSNGYGDDTNLVCNGCKFYGYVEDDYAATNAAQGAQFNNCVFSDNPSPKTYPVTDHCALVMVDGGEYITFSGCTFDATQTTGLYIISSATFDPNTHAMTGGVTITGCNITHAYTGFQSGDISLIEGATLTNTNFYEGAGMASGLKIMGSNVYVNSNVTVQGPNCLWYGGFTHTGTIPIGMYGPY